MKWRSVNKLILMKSKILINDSSNCYIDRLSHGYMFHYCIQNLWLYKAKGLEIN